MKDKKVVFLRNDCITNPYDQPHISCCFFVITRQNNLQENHSYIIPC